MRTYAQYCPIVRAAEILGDRWTLLIVREMLNGVRRFNDIARGLPGLSRALLSRRLRQLQNAGLVVRSADGYELTRAGRDLRGLVLGLAAWGARYAFGDPRPDELDPETLMWWLHGRIDTSDVTGRAVIQIEVSDHRRTFWLVVEPGDASVCYVDPGFDIDAVLASDLATLYRMWEGEIELRDAIRDGAITLTGARWIVRGLPDWLLLSPVAPHVRAARLASSAAFDEVADDVGAGMSRAGAVPARVDLG
ncbi:MAG TPA: helix-turn-helix domain-containing protein [Actinophytocola sp.]|uniref:winged helix-turn-helix transcriptional regulator n=1 Tax=Actinophytocola sp. TaxID=1872138 RepID=UPI002DDD010D|nr:helix-turn-helix domain-containing protein [Actinophytocola sp.]HEV2782820.1 helix-turn-helix domain-containing protein [Actinophytocola sp.]